MKNTFSFLLRLRDAFRGKAPALSAPHAPADDSSAIIGKRAIKDAVKKLHVDLTALVAETALWASPRACDRLREETGDVVRFPHKRRGRKGERIGNVINGIEISDDTYAHATIKEALGTKRIIVGYGTCYVWSDTRYDERYYTAIPNIMLLPYALGGIFMLFDDVLAALQYHSFELYQWYPEKCGEPTKPAKYPANWKEPLGG